MQGNPLVGCTEVGCRSNYDCRDDEKCEFATKECIPLCTNNPCAEGASCSARNHKELCMCDYPLEGDGYTSCNEPSKFSFQLEHKSLSNPNRIKQWNMKKIK